MVYILGIGRSGSTLLTALLNNHAEMKAVPEVPLVLFFANEFKNINEKSQKLENLAKDYLEHIQLIRPKSLVNISNVDFTGISYNSYAEFCKKVFEQFAVINSKGQKKVYIDKNPQYSLFISAIRTIDHEAKFIVLVRDYRDNVLSRKKKQNNKPTNIAYNAFRNRFFLKQLVKNCNNKDCKIITYEDLVSNPQEKLLEICSFLNVEFNDSIFNIPEYQQSDLEVDFNPLNEFIHTHFSQLNKPITTNAIGKWKKEFSKNEVTLIESICGRYGSYFGYKTSTIKQSYFRIVIFNLPQYCKAKWHIWKGKIIYKIPSKIKLRILKKKLQKG